MEGKNISEEILSDEQLRTLLLDYGVVSEEQMALAQDRVKLEGGTLRESVLWHNFITDAEMGKLFAEHLQVPFVRLTDKTIPADVTSLVPEVVARKQKFVIFKHDVDGLHVATSDPRNSEVLSFLGRKMGEPVRMYYATEPDILDCLNRHHAETSTTFEELLKHVEEGKTEDGEPFIVHVTDTLVREAHRNKASDIHLEPRDYDALVRFRIDGVLHDITKWGKEIHDQILSRIKVISGLRTDEHQAPQDGKFQVEIEGEQIDVRVSVIPVTNGEKVVMRLLSEKSRQFSLGNLGLEGKDLETMQSAYAKPYGMILVTGPTGCGKTTTLYSVLKLLNRREVNIMTIEDPVEYDVEGVNQIQVNPEAHLTFASGLRSILRQDPNIILVGEIRDDETAGIAVNLAMTGHLVLSTLHTNDAATTIPRLLDMHIEPFLIASTVNVIVAQRLVRTIHEACRVSEEISVEALCEKVGEKTCDLVFAEEMKNKTVHLYRGKGCDRCHGTGYLGRTGVFEVLVMSDRVRDAIVRHESSVNIARIAESEGMRTMLRDGLEKVRHGVTTLDEVLRVIQDK